MTGPRCCIIQAKVMWIMQHARGVDANQAIQGDRRRGEGWDMVGVEEVRG